MVTEKKHLSLLARCNLFLKLRIGQNKGCGLSVLAKKQRRGVTAPLKGGMTNANDFSIVE